MIPSETYIKKVKLLKQLEKAIKQKMQLEEKLYILHQPKTITKNRIIKNKSIFNLLYQSNLHLIKKIYKYINHKIQLIISYFYYQINTYMQNDEYFCTCGCSSKLWNLKRILNKLKIINHKVKVKDNINYKSNLKKWKS